MSWQRGQPTPLTATDGNDTFGNNPFWQVQRPQTKIANPYLTTPFYNFNFHQDSALYRLQVKWEFLRARVGPDSSSSHGWDNVEWCRSGA